ncbi:MAG: toprim domain-containing protein [Patescibacteria group bacterium]
MNSIEKLAEIFRQFPGTGPRQAKRFVHFLLAQNSEFLNELSAQITNLKSGIAQCAACQRFFSQTKMSALCDICADTSRDSTLLMIVEKDVDCDSVRRMDGYRGHFFILGGTLPILERDPTRKVRARELVTQVEGRAKNGLKEVILAFSVNPEGENTAQYIKKTIEPLAQKHGIKISTLGRGLSTGTELEYSDSDTIKNALRNRS